MTLIILQVSQVTAASSRINYSDLSLERTSFMILSQTLYRCVTDAVVQIKKTEIFFQGRKKIGKERKREKKRKERSRDITRDGFSFTFFFKVDAHKVFSF